MTPLNSIRWTLYASWPLAHGEALHGAALAAAHSGERTLAARLFAAAGKAYRRELQLLPLARLRVHERILRWKSDGGDAVLAAEIEDRLERLDAIESPEAPFELVPARLLASRWRGDGAPIASVPDAALAA